MIAKDLTDDQRLAFVEEFYREWAFGPDDIDSEKPWGCPWLYNCNILLTGDSVKEMARNYWHDCYSEIVASFEEEYADIDHYERWIA